MMDIKQVFFQKLPDVAVRVILRLGQITISDSIPFMKNSVHDPCQAELRSVVYREQNVDEVSAFSGILW